MGRQDRLAEVSGVWCGCPERHRAPPGTVSPQDPHSRNESEQFHLRPDEQRLGGLPALRIPQSLSGIG